MAGIDHIFSQKKRVVNVNVAFSEVAFNLELECNTEVEDV